MQVHTEDTANDCRDFLSDPETDEDAEMVTVNKGAEEEELMWTEDVELLNMPEDFESKCLSSAFNCFQNASLHLEPANSQSSRNFEVMITRLRRPVITHTITDMVGLFDMFPNLIIAPYFA
ncbi:unnamed protein product [Caretta caretta]